MRNEVKGSRRVTRITPEGIQKHFKSYDQVRPIIELVANGLDSGSSVVSIETKRNQLEVITQAKISDVGEGIDTNNLEANFGRFNDSSKKYDDDMHGAHGRGRLGFHVICGNATWYTKRGDINAKISIHSSSIDEYDFDEISAENQCSQLQESDSGTCVFLDNFLDRGFPSCNNLRKGLSRRFGYYLALNPKSQILLDGTPIEIPSHELHEETFKVESIDFHAKVIRWDERPIAEKSYNYMISSDFKILQKDLSSLNNKVNFFSSAYVFSDWIDKYDPNVGEVDPSTAKVVRGLQSKLTSLQREIYEDYLRHFVDKIVDGYDEGGFFPTYKDVGRDYAEYRKKNTKDVIKTIYLADPSVFNNLREKQTKILIHLLDKILVSNENDALLDVLNGILELDQDHIELLADQIHKTTLENIISTIEVLQKRQAVIHQLKEVMDKRFDEVLETPDLQKIIEQHTWLFGPQYTTLGAEEDTFTGIARNLRDEIPEVGVITDDDIEEGTNLEGVNKQVDLFLARKAPAFGPDGQHIFKCVIIEIKRPGVSLNKKHLAQLDNYAEIIQNHPAFNAEQMKFELILVGRKISSHDIQIENRLTSNQNHGQLGLVSFTPKIRSYVKTWSTIFADFELTNSYLLEKLQTKMRDISNDTTGSLVNELQSTPA